MWSFLPSVIFIASVSTVFAQGDKDDFPLNEFRHRGGTLVCFSRSDVSKGYTPCLRIGDLAIGLRLEEIEEKIKKIGGRFVETHLGRAGAETRLYYLRPEKGVKDLPSLVVAYSGGRAEAIQLSGGRTEAPLAFSSIRLGDSPLQVVGLIGPAYSTEHDPGTNGTLWEYGPFPFNIEFKNGKVYSIRIRMLHEGGE
ncbi:MAG TPA: hypothetical protein VJ873_09330 [bacterium]|nr:hypothetical protein [bacterium]